MAGGTLLPARQERFVTLADTTFPFAAMSSGNDADPSTASIELRPVSYVSTAGPSSYPPQGRTLPPSEQASESYGGVSFFSFVDAGLGAQSPLREASTLVSRVTDRLTTARRNGPLLDETLFTQASGIPVSLRAILRSLCGGRNGRGDEPDSILCGCRCVAGSRCLGLHGCCVPA